MEMKIQGKYEDNIAGFQIKDNKMINFEEEIENENNMYKKWD